MSVKRTLILAESIISQKQKQIMIYAKNVLMNR